MTIPIQTPCCQRKLRPAPLMHSATHVCRRTCPKCGLSYQVKIAPAIEITQGLASVLEWSHIQTITEP